MGGEEFYRSYKHFFLIIYLPNLNIDIFISLDGREYLIIIYFDVSTDININLNSKSESLYELSQFFLVDYCELFLIVCIYKLKRQLFREDDSVKKILLYIL